MYFMFMTDSILSRRTVSLTDVLEAKDITPVLKLDYALDMGATFDAIRKRVSELKVPDGEEILQLMR